MCPGDAVHQNLKKAQYRRRRAKEMIEEVVAAATTMKETNTKRRQAPGDTKLLRGMKRQSSEERIFRRKLSWCGEKKVANGEILA